MKIDLEKIERNTGRKFENIEQLYFYLVYIMDFLRANNKNYNKKQYEKIIELWEMIQAIEL